MSSTPFPARFPGKCARTGANYAAGALIVKLSSGKYALAQDKKGNVKVLPEYRLVRLPDGTEKQMPVNLTLACSVCVRAAGIDPAKTPKDFSAAPFAMTREGNLITCPRCGHRVEIVSDAELAARKAAQEAETEARRAADRDANLHLEPAGWGLWRLSHRIPEAQWKLVVDYFVYWSHDDLDQMDIFDMPGGYYLRPGAAPEGVILNSPMGAEASTAEAVENLLNIRPENRLEVLIPKWEAQKQAREQREALAKERRKIFHALFDWQHPDAVSESEKPSGEQIPIGDQSGATKCLILSADGESVSDYFRGWADMVIETCYRFPLTPERAEAVQWLREGWIK